MNKLSSFSFAIVMLFLNSCKSHNNTGHNDSLKTKDSTDLSIKKIGSVGKEDSIKLTELVRKLYQWHETDTNKIDGFSPTKRNTSDTLYSGIDLDENKRAIAKLEQTGIFSGDFFNDYRNIAIRMDKELRNGTSLWREGELPTFNDDVDEWCNCQDYPVDNYWKVIKLTNVVLSKDEASFRWTWGDNFYYKVKAKKDNGNWKISYLEGFDMNYYNWEWVTKHKK